ncbi:MAG: hypothetical protein WBL61_17735 [Bryobacteraceae bacterium]
MIRRTVTAGLYPQKADERRLVTLCARRAALTKAIRHLKDYRRLRAKRVAAGLLKIA